MALEQLDPPIDFLSQAQPLPHQVDSANATVIDPSVPFSHLEMDVAGAQHRSRLFTPAPFGIQATLDSVLAITQDLRVTSTHSKCLSSLVWLASSLPSTPSI